MRVPETSYLVDLTPLPLDERERRGGIGPLTVGAIGFLVASAMGDHWRTAVFVAGVPGLALAWLLLKLPDPPRGVADAWEMGEHVDFVSSPTVGQTLGGVP